MLIVSLDIYFSNIAIAINVKAKGKETNYHPLPGRTEGNLGPTVLMIYGKVLDKDQLWSLRCGM